MSSKPRKHEGTPAKLTRIGRAALEGVRGGGMDPIAFQELVTLTSAAGISVCVGSICYLNRMIRRSKEMFGDDKKKKGPG